MERFLKPTFTKVVEKEQAENISTFTLSKLERGYGNTIGNAMRRAIISSVPGLSPFAVEIKGVSHEYQAIPGTSQDAVELVLNLKELVLVAEEAMLDTDEVYTLTLKSTKGEVKAGDIVTPAGIEVANKDLVLATTNKDKALDMKIYVAYSKGFKTFEETTAYADESIEGKRGVIFMDANFSPIKRVNVKVEEVNPGESVVFERLVLEVETKGAIAPEKAVAYAASVLTNYYAAFQEMNTFNADEDFEEEVIVEVNEELSITIDSLNLSTRSENALLA